MGHSRAATATVTRRSTRTHKRLAAAIVEVNQVSELTSMRRALPNVTAFT